MADETVRPQVLLSTAPPTDFPLPTPTPAATPSPIATAPPFGLHNEGRSVESVTMTAHPVHNPGAEQLGALHIGEVIKYTDGTMDVVGYFPEGKSLLQDGDPMYVERSIGSQTPQQYLAEAKQHYTLDVKPVLGETLDQLVARQAKDWKAYNTSQEPPRYDFSGQLTHNSNSAMVGSLIAAGRPDVANTLMQNLEPPDRMHELERTMTPEQASMKLALERKIASLPSSPERLTR